MGRLDYSGKNNNFVTLPDNAEDDDAIKDAVVAEYKVFLKTDKLVVVDFFAEWCGPCRTIAPKFKEFAEEFDNCYFVKVDVDAFESIAEENGISCMPTFIFFKKGEKVHTFSGANEKSLREKIIELAK